MRRLEKTTQLPGLRAVPSKWLSTQLKTEKRNCECPHWADSVEKLRISDVVIFRIEPVMPKSPMRFAMRRSELPHERHKASLAEPLAVKSWSRCTDKNLTDSAKNGVFQRYRLPAVIDPKTGEWPDCPEPYL